MQKSNVTSCIKKTRKKTRKKKSKKICVFESDILHILLADSILSTTKRFRKMKKLQFLKVGDYMKTITRATKHPPI